jgi:hypothetical protein
MGETTNVPNLVFMICKDSAPTCERFLASTLPPPWSLLPARCFGWLPVVPLLDTTKADGCRLYMYIYISERVGKKQRRMEWERQQVKEPPASFLAG